MLIPALGLALAGVCALVLTAEARPRGAQGPRFAALSGPVQADAPVAVAVKRQQVGENTRLIFDLSREVGVTAFVLAGPDRVIVDLPEVNFQLDAMAGQPTAPERTKGKAKDAPKSTELISSFRFGHLGPGKSRVVIDLGAPAKIVKAFSEKMTDGDPAHLIIELAPTDAAQFAAAAAQAPRPTRVVTPEVPKKPEPPRIKAAQSDKPLVILDPGHGGVDTGAAGAFDSVEKHIVLDFAKELATKLEASGKVRVQLTRTSDVFVSLGGRVKLARDSGAGLFVSLHADSLREGGVAGATVYTVSDRASDREAARVAEQENQADANAGIEVAEDQSDVTDILFDLTRRETRAYSHVYARTLVNYWKVAGKLNKNPQRSAGFVVLKAPDVPSILLELGYLSSKQDAESLMSREWRDKTTNAVAQSIESFFAPRTPTKAEAAVGVDHNSTGTIAVRSENGASSSLRSIIP